MKRGSLHNGRANKKMMAFNVDHNDRNFESERDDHIDVERSHDNIYYTINDEGELIERPGFMGSFKEIERDFYEENFREHLDAKNREYIEQRHPDRCRTMDQYRESYRSCPEETIFQIGNVNDGFWDEYKFDDCLRDYCKKMTEQYPDIKILDVAVHKDEASLHAHIRRVYMAEDKFGHPEAAQHKCLEKAGFKLPYEDKPRGRNNNLKIPFSKAEREIFLDVCMDHGIELERVPKHTPESRVQRTMAEYQAEQEHQKLREVKQELISTEVDLDFKTKRKQKLEAEIAEKEEYKQELNKTIKADEKHLAKIEQQIKQGENKMEVMQARYSAVVQKHNEALKMAEKAVLIKKPLIVKKDSMVTYHAKSLEDLEDLIDETRHMLNESVAESKKAAVDRTIAEQKEAEIGSLHDEAVADREEARTMKRDQEKLINERAEKMADEKFNNFKLSQQSPEIGRSQRLENFMNKHAPGLMENFEANELKVIRNITQEWDNFRMR